MIEYVFSNVRKVRSYKLPENYNELTCKQVIGIAGVFLKNMQAEMAQLEVLRILLNKRPFAFFLIPLDAKAGMMRHITWVFEKNGLTSQFLPLYKGLYGPRSDWDNLTMAEWSDAEVYYEWMVNDRDDNAINCLIAVLYRKGKKNYDIDKDSEGDIRQPYNHNETAYWAKKIACWPDSVKTAILMWYDGCREFVIGAYDVFESGTAESEKKSPGMFELIRGMCGVRYGSFEMVERMNVHKALREMELMKQEAEQLKRNTA